MQFGICVASRPADLRHQRVHLGHNCWVLPEEERFVTADLLTRSCLIGTPRQLADRIRELDEAGLDQVVVLPTLDEKEAVITGIARLVMALLSSGTSPR